jgi:hypothetical protein
MRCLEQGRDQPATQRSMSGWVSGQVGQPTPADALKGPRSVCVEGAATLP